MPVPLERDDRLAVEVFPHPARPVPNWTGRQMGDQFTVADAYLFTVLGWGAFVGVDIGPRLKNYVERVRARPHVIEAMMAEGLIKK